MVNSELGAEPAVEAGQEDFRAWAPRNWSRGPLPVVIGVTGHRDLRPEDSDRLEQSVGRIFSEVQRQCPNCMLVLLSPLAEGADRLVARVALRQGVRLICPLPLPVPLYSDDFTDDTVMFWSAAGFPRLVNGSSGFDPSELVALRAQATGFPDRASVDYLVGRARYTDNPRGCIIGEQEGFLKLIFSRPELKLLGVHAIGEHASELVHIGLVAMTAGCDATVFSCRAPAFPYRSE